MNEIELKITKSMFMSVLKTSAIVDKTSSWFLGGVAATSALLIANISAISIFISSNIIGLMIMLLIISIMFGFIQKYLATRINIHVSVTEAIEPIVEQNVSKGTEVDFLKIVGVIKKATPWYQKKEVEKSIVESAKDPLYGYKNASKMYNRQIFYTLLQVSIALLVLAIAATNINKI